MEEDKQSKNKENNQEIYKNSENNQGIYKNSHFMRGNGWRLSCRKWNIGSAVWVVKSWKEANRRTNKVKSIRGRKGGMINGFD